MPKGDIDLPNRSGVVDPTIGPRADRQRSLALNRQFATREQTRLAAAPVKRSVGRRMLDARRALLGTR